MATLKEIKTRIGSVQNTLKITSAMKMVSSAKLHQAQNAAVSFKLYDDAVNSLVGTLRSDTPYELTSVFTDSHEVKQHATIVAFASDSSLCGAFNTLSIHNFTKEFEKMQHSGYTDITVYPVGEKMVQAATKAGYTLCKDYSTLSSKFSYEKTSALATHLTELYASGRTDNVAIVYSHFKSIGKQIPTHITLLPISQFENKAVEFKNSFIREPQASDLYHQLLTKLISTRLHSILIDSIMAEQAARSVAMQIATDEAEKLLNELTLTYNKLRQKAITDELSLLAQSDY